MSRARVVIYYAWSLPDETSAPLGTIENRFPTLFESRRMLYPRYAELADANRFDQGIGGFVDQILRRNFEAFVEQARSVHRRSVQEAQRVDAGNRRTPIDEALLEGADTLIVISFDSLRTAQQASIAEIDAVRRFLAQPGSLVFVCPHHDVGCTDYEPPEDRSNVQIADFLHHGDRTLPPRQGFGGFGRSILGGLGVPVENRFGLRPAAGADGSPAPLEIDRKLDRLKLLEGVTTFNLHQHLPQLERLGDAVAKLEVLARQKIDLAAPPHRYAAIGSNTFDALLQSRPSVFAGNLLVGDATLWSSTAGGLDSLERLWGNVFR